MLFVPPSVPTPYLEYKLHERKIKTATLIDALPAPGMVPNIDENGTASD